MSVRTEKPTDGWGGATPNRLWNCCRNASCRACKVWTSCVLCDDGKGQAIPGGIVMGRGPGAKDWRVVSDVAWRDPMLLCDVYQSRWGIASITASGSCRGMGWCSGTAVMDNDHCRNGVIWMGKDVCCGRSPMDSLPTASKEPLGPVALTGGDNMASLVADCLTAWLPDWQRQQPEFQMSAEVIQRLVKSQWMLA